MKRSTKKADKTSAEINAAQVVSYLEHHPNFFRQQLKLLGKLEIPHDVDGAVSLIESQVRVLRGENELIRKERRELLEAVGANDALAKRLHGALQGLLAADTPEKFFHEVNQQLPRRLSVQNVKLVLFGQVPAQYSSNFPWSGFEGGTPKEHPQYAHLLKGGKPRALVLDRGEAILYFGEEGEDIHSAICLPLLGRCWQGLLLMGSSSPDRFSGEVRFEMVGSFAQLLATLLDRWVGFSP